MQKPKPPEPDWSWEDDWAQVDSGTFENRSTGLKVIRNSEWSGRDPLRWYIQDVRFEHINLERTLTGGSSKARTFTDPDKAKKIANEYAIPWMVARQMGQAYKKGYHDALAAVRSGIRTAAELIDQPRKKSVKR